MQQERSSMSLIFIEILNIFYDNTSDEYLMDERYIGACRIKFDKLVNGTNRKIGLTHSFV